MNERLGDPASGGGEALDKELHEVRIVGRGGQGAVTAGELLGRAAVREGSWAQSIPTFGPERRGALSSATLRISTTEILLKCSVANPGVLLVLDPTVWHHYPVMAGLLEGGTLIFNTPVAPQELEQSLRSGRFGQPLPVERCELYAVDATGIALQILGRPITNTAMMGALCGATGIIGLEAVEQTLLERFGEKATLNIDAARAARDGLRRLGD